MPMTLGDIKKFVLHQLQKNPSYGGFYTDEKVAVAIQEAMDYVATKMFVAGGGLMKRIGYIDSDTLDAFGNPSATFSLPADCAIVDVVRYKSSDTYIPVEYQSDELTPQVTSALSTQFPTKYRLIGDQIYFNPKPTILGANYIQVEYMSYPAWLLDDDQKVEADFDRCMCWYVKYRAATVLVLANGGVPTWAGVEAEWREQADLIIHKRIKKPRYVKEFME